MATRIGSLVIKLAVDHAMVKPGLDRAQHETAKASRAMQQRLATLARGVAVAGAAIVSAIGGAAAALGKLAFDSIRTADQISKAAQAIGMGTEELSRLRYAADISGVAFESLQANLGRFNRGLFDAMNGTGKTGAALARLGIEIRTAEGATKSQTQLLGELANRFQAMPDGVEKSALAMQIFGKNGAEMIPFLNQGAEGIAKLTDEADRFGVVIDEETGRRAEAFNDNLTRLKGAFDALATAIAADMLPYLVELTDWFVKNAGKMREWAGVVRGAIRDSLDLARGVGELGRGLLELPGAISGANTFFDALRQRMILALGPAAVLLDKLRAIGAAANNRDAVGLGDGSRMKSWSAIIADSGVVMDRTRKSAQDLFETVATGGGGRSRGGAGAGRSAIGRIRDEAEEAARALDRLRSDFRSVQNQLDPALAAYRRTGEQQGLINDARRAGIVTQEEANRLIGLTLEVSEGFATIDEKLPLMAKAANDNTRIVADNFAQMSERVMNSLQGLSSSIKSGDFLGILGGLVNMFVQLGSTGLFGKSIAANINAPRIPGNANGTAFHPGGLMMVGERGPEILQVPRGGRVVPNHELRAAGEQQVRIILDERTDIVAARIDGRIGAASGAIAEGGAQIAQARLARRQTRRIG